MNTVIIIMGVSGTGKSTLAKALADHLHWQFMEADDYHSDDAKNMMKAGIALTDHIREPWIQRMLNTLSHQANNKTNTVLSYSGLKQKHRNKFRELPSKVHFIHLQGSKALIRERMQNRTGHFMASNLLDSQFDAMESTEHEADVTPISIDNSQEHLLQDILSII